MDLRQPDPAYTASRKSRQNFALAVRLAALFLALVWLVFLLQWLLPFDLVRFGLRPREWTGLAGLLTTPLLHGSLSHIASNSVPLFVGGVAMLFLYPNSSLRALPVIYVGSSALAWLFARSSIHIGASGLVYGVLTFVFVSGIIRRDLRSVGVSLLIWFFYGSMIWGVLPVQRGMSWELHASGMVIGMVMAIVYRHYDWPPLKRYTWEDEDDEGTSDKSGLGDSRSRPESPEKFDDRWH